MSVLTLPSKGPASLLAPPVTSRLTSTCSAGRQTSYGQGRMLSQVCRLIHSLADQVSLHGTASALCHVVLSCAWMECRGGQQRITKCCSYSWVCTSRQRVACEPQAHAACGCGCAGEASSNCEVLLRAGPVCTPPPSASLAVSITCCAVMGVQGRPAAVTQCCFALVLLPRVWRPPHAQRLICSLKHMLCVVCVQGRPAAIPSHLPMAFT
jgi:hypothetical protein